MIRRCPCRGRIIGVLVAICQLACSESESRVIVALVDGSSSRTATEEYARAWHQFVESARPGDRLVLGRIRGDAVGFRPEFDETLPERAWLFDNVFIRRRRLFDFQSRAREALTAALALSTLDTTPILDTLTAIQPVFDSATQPTRVLILLSDMLEDSTVAKFAAEGGLDAGKLIAARSRQDAVPNLSGVDVFVVGASARTSERLRTVERFWFEYFRACRANLEPSHYGSALFIRPGL